MATLRILLPVTLLLTVSTAWAQDAQDEEPFDQERFDASYDRWHGGRREADLIRTIGWELTLIAIGTAWYWSEKDLNSLDWDYPTAWERINGDAVRFDDNRFLTNTLGHPAAGLGYYGLARVSGLEPWQAVVTAFLSSALWEFGLEWREQVSINDQIFTPVAGIALGEVAFQLGEYLNSAPGGGGWAQRVAGATLGFPRWLHDRFDGDEARAPEDLPADELGFSSAFSHRFRLTYEWQGLESDAGTTATLHGVRADVELVSMPGFMEPGSFDVLFAHGNFSEFSLLVGSAGRGVDDFDMRARSTLAGWYTQDVHEDDRGSVSGHGAMIGVSTAFRHTDQHLLDRTDQVAVAGIAGPSAELRLRTGDLDARFGGDLHADFAAVRSMAFPGWHRDNGSQGIRSVLYKRGYYYGFGFSTRLRAELAFRGLELGGSLGYGSWRSIEGLDRAQESVTRDVPMSDRQLEYEAWVGYTLPGTPLHLRLGTRGEERAGRMEDARETRWTRRLTGSAGLAF